MVCLWKYDIMAALVSRDTPADQNAVKPIQQVEIPGEIM
jgi:hypothetical protein